MQKILLARPTCRLRADRIIPYKNKPIMRFIYLTFFLSLAAFSLSAQCILSNPVSTGQDITPYEGDWSFANFFGAASGYDYVTFSADTGKCYVITTLPQLVGYASNLDFQVTVIDDASGLAAPGYFGSAFNDDHNYGAGYTGPLLIWRPSTNGTYRIVVTKYSGSGCLELGFSDNVRLGISSFKAAAKVAFVASIADTFWTSPNNWTHIAAGGARGVGRPANIDEYQVYAASTLVQPAASRLIHLDTDTIRNLLVGTVCTLRVANRLELLDSLHVYYQGILDGAGVSCCKSSP
ncbi:MAG: hypothetical protein R3B47_11530 [Bacteroidia bacterium]